jgi:hypothetical protein
MRIVTSSLGTSDLPRKVVQSIERTKLDLAGLRVLTEAATGAYAVTPVLAAVAGAEVTAFAKSSHYGTVEEAHRQVLELAQQLEVGDRIHFIETLTSREIAEADIVTNSGHLRPLDAAFVRQMKPGAAIPLMYESWELRPGEVDLEACQSRGIHVAGTNECHAQVRVFDYLGMLALHGLFRCQVPVCFSRLLMICDNPFAPHIAKTLLDCGAEVEVFAGTPLPESIRVTHRSTATSTSYDAVVVADTPSLGYTIGRNGAVKYSVEQIGSFPALVQILGDIDRSSMPDIIYYPAIEPRKGHMGVMLHELGPDPILRLQAGGLKVGEVLVRCPAPSGTDAEFCQPLVARIASNDPIGQPG